MKLLFLCKRRPMGKDLITHPYGRFFFIPQIMADRGHEVTVALLSYRRELPVDATRSNVRWISESIFSAAGRNYLAQITRLMQQSAPDWVVGMSDTYFGILAEQLGRLYGIRSLIDAYDNFEGYVPWCKPLHWIWRRALVKATAISAAGPALAALMNQGRQNTSPIITPMAVDPTGFHPLAREQCRSKLGLPVNAKLIGYFGSIDRNRGIDTLFDAVSHLQKKLPDVHLVLSGRLDPRVRLPASALWLGYIADCDLPALTNSVDVAAVINQSSSFGNYSYPIKLYEAMCCHVPVVVSRTPATATILCDYDELMFEPENRQALIHTLERALTLGRIDYGPLQTWQDVVARLEQSLLERSSDS